MVVSTTKKPKVKKVKTAIKKAVRAPRVKKVVVVKPKIKAVAVPKEKKVAGTEEIGRIRIRVSAYEHKLLDASVKQILDTALRHNATVRGPVPLPTEIKKYTVNRAAFIYKNAREQFEMRIHKRLIDIVNPSPPLIEALTNLTLPSGVSIDVKML